MFYDIGFDILENTTFGTWIEVQKWTVSLFDGNHNDAKKNVISVIGVKENYNVIRKFILKPPSSSRIVIKLFNITQLHGILLSS